MSLDFKGSISIGALCPLALSAVAPMTTQLTAQLAGAVALTASLTVTPPAILAAIAQVEALIAALENMLAHGLDFPPPTLQLAAVASLIASINATLGILTELSSLFASAGVSVYVYEGPASGFGPAVTPVFPGSSEEFAIVLSAGADAGVRSSLLAFFGGAA